MEEKEYIEFLDKAYSQLPEDLGNVKRFDIPKASGRIIRSRTQISNFRDVAKKFSRDTDHLYKFMIKELGVRGELDDKEQLTLHSRFQPNVLNKAIENYFESYVKCSNCGSPDSELIENGTVVKCNACGNKRNVSKL